MEPAAFAGIPREGDVIDGKYRVERVLGHGGYGLVAAARHVSLDQPVAVKFLLPEVLRRPGAAERFLREARAAAMIRSDHVARIFDVGTLENGVPYFVMEHLTGSDLAKVLAARGTLPVHEAVDYVLQVCEAMAEAHALGVVHRDLKPGNLFLAEAGGAPRIKVLDFGLSKVMAPDDGSPDAASASLTTSGTVMGSVPYMAPEQLKQLKDADTRSDIWALGVILYELIAGRRPFDKPSIPETLLRIGHYPPEPIEAWVKGLPEELILVIMTCLEKDKRARPQTMSALARSLAPFAGDHGRASAQRALRHEAPETRAGAPATTELSDVDSTPPPPPPDPPPPPVVASGMLASSVSPPQREPRSRSRLVAIAVAASLLGGVAGYGAIRRFQRASSVIDADRLASFSPLPAAPATPPAPHEALRAHLGGALFVDPRLSKNGDVACSTCHPLDRHGADGKRLSRGSDDREPPRNTLAIYNTAGFFAYSWDGRQTTLLDQAKEVLQSPRAMAVTPDALAQKLDAVPDYRERFAKAFPEDKQPVSFDNVARALAAFEATLFTRGRWDRFLEGETAALTDREKAGFNRFVDVGCVACHFGPEVGATMFQKVGLVKAWPNTKDRGRYEITKRDADLMVFRVPSLRNVAMTSPYFHDGSVASLDEAIRMMAKHQIGRDLDDEDVSLIRSWLESLTGDLPHSPDHG